MNQPQNWYLYYDHLTPFCSIRIALNLLLGIFIPFLFLLLDKIELNAFLEGYSLVCEDENVSDLLFECITKRIFKEFLIFYFKYFMC